MSSLEDAKTAKKKRASAKAKFSRIHKIFIQKIDESEDYYVIDQLMTELNQAYTEFELKHELYVELVDSGDENSDFNAETENSYIDNVYDDLCKCRTMHIKLQQRNLPPTPIPAVTLPQSVPTPQNAAIKVKRIEPPIFSGNLRDYPSFKNDYNRHMLPAYGNDPYALKNSLSGDALKVVMGIEDNFLEMFKRLDLKYGDPSKLVDSVISEISKLDYIPPDDYEKFINLVNTVERCYLDLKKLNMEAEMNTVAITSKIERLLPPIQRREWVICKQKYSNPTDVKFCDFLEFLLKEKDALEYMLSTIRNNCQENVTKSKINNVNAIEISADEGAVGFANNIQKQMDKQQELLSDVVEKLSLITQGINQVDNNRKVHAGNNFSREKKFKCWYHSTDNHMIEECTGFKSVTNEQKLELIKRNGCCFNCLKPGHVSRVCQNKKICGTSDGNGVCNKFHHPSLHSAHASGLAFHNNSFASAVDSKLRENAVLSCNKIVCNGVSVMTLWDSGANVSLIKHKTAQKLNLAGKSVTLSLTKVGNDASTHVTKEYKLPVTDLSGVTWHLCVYGIDEITAELPPINGKTISELFSEITESDVTFHSGKIDLLIGTDNCSLLPEKVKQINNLQLLKNPFGYSIRGSYPGICLTKNPSNGLSVVINKLYGKLLNPEIICVANTATLKNHIESYFSIENLGIACQPKCGNCRCGKCPIGNKEYTLIEERELAMIKDGLSYNSDKRQWMINYPWIKDPNCLPNNYNSANSRLLSTEKRLLRMGTEYSNMYNAQMEDMFNRKAARLLDPIELENYNGPVHYIHHHEILKPSSLSTPLRIVFNSSSLYLGHSLNDYWAKGPDMLNNLFSVLLRFRQGIYAVVGDISKMYNCVELSLLDQHTHRFLWRNFETDIKPLQYAMTTVTFGDRPSGSIVIQAMKNTADMKIEEYPEAAKVIHEDSYVDDILTSRDTLNEIKELTLGVQNVLAFGGFNIKSWVISGMDHLKMENLEGINLIDSGQEKVLGMLWDTKRDCFFFKVKVNFSEKKRNLFLGPNVSSENLNEELPVNLTRRMVLRHTASIYDPFGLLTPFTLMGKFLIRDLCSKQVVNDKSNSIWDEPMTLEERDKWRQFFGQLFEVEKLTFPRCLKMNVMVKNPMLIIFSDGSKFAYGSCAYIRWESLDSAHANSVLIASKSRIAPTRQLSVPRLELCGAVLSARLRISIETSLNIEFTEVIHIVDSMIVLAQINKESYGFGTFTAVRIGEIQSKTNPKEWWWLAGESNIADLTTRPSLPSCLDCDSLWQSGPAFLKYQFSDWPISQNCQIIESEIPDTLKSNVQVLSANVKSKNIVVDVSIIDIEKFSSFNKLIHVTAIMLIIAKNRTFKNCVNKVNKEYLTLAENSWILYLQRDLLLDNWSTRFRRLSPYMNSNGIIVVGKRLENWLRDSWTDNEVILIPEHNKFAKLIVLQFHEQGHMGVEATLTKVRSRFWIPRARKIVKSVRANCYKCKKIDLKIVGQEMGPLALSRLKPSPPFYNSAVDIFGPVYIRDTVKKRTTCKVYGVLFNCLACRAVYLDLSEGYDTNSFIMILRRFVCMYGYPKSLVSDRGSQLVCADKELQSMLSNWDWDAIGRFGLDQGLEWKLTKSADAPWENGCSEALIKSTKRCLKFSVGSNVLSFSEMQTVLFEVGNLLNERPIGIKNLEPDDGKYLCPNDLLLGRSSTHVPQGPWNDTKDPRNRLSFVQNIVDNFWKRWHRDYFYSLIIRQKWHTATRNLLVGDIVMVQDRNALRGVWKLAEVCEATPGSDGKVRDVTIRYKPQSLGKSYKGAQDILVKRSAHRLVVIVPADDQ